MPASPPKIPGIKSGRIGKHRCKATYQKTIQTRKPILCPIISLTTTNTTGSIVAAFFNAWRWQLEGATLKGNLRLHLICALTSASLIFLLCWMRTRLRAKGISPRIAYFTVTVLALMVITLTGHLGGILSGVETP